MNQDALKALTAARTALLLDHYFFGRLALHLKLVEDLSVETLAVDGRHIFYNPHFVLTLTPNLVKSGIAHEVTHCILNHMTRRNGRDPDLWNQAIDFVSNEMLVKNNFRIGKGWYHSTAYYGMSAEHIYDLLVSEGKEGNKPDGEKFDEVRDAASTPAEMTEVQFEWQIAVSQAATAAKAAGKLPAGMERFAEPAVAKVSWREQLQRFVDQVTKNDYSWVRPNRRMMSQGIYMPGLYSQSLGVFVDAIDTSGSIDQPTLDVFGGEVQAAVAASSPEKVVQIYCDARINKVDEFDLGQEMTFEMCGGGGTDFRPPFRYLEEKSIQPSCMIYLTDGYGPFPAEPPDYPVLWCITSDVVAPWGETLHIDV